MFIQTEITPNPHSLKFLPNTTINLVEQPVFFNEAQEVKGKSDLADQLFGINNVKSVFFGSDFITITKEEDGDWLVLKPEILMIIMEHFVSGFTALNEHGNDKALQSINEGASEIETQIIEIINTRVRPSVAMDGGDIIYKGFENGVVLLEMHGACAGCPSSSVTLKNGIESMLKHFVPEVESVKDINE